MGCLRPLPRVGTTMRTVVQERALVRHVDCTLFDGTAFQPPPENHLRRETMQVNEAMTHQVRVTHPRQSIRDAARVMAEIDAGALPVGEDGRLVGMITDRDIAVRAVAQGKGPYTAVRDVMTVDVKYCFEDEEVDHVARNMGDIQVRRLPV